MTPVAVVCRPLMVDRHGTDLELKFSAAEDRRRRGKRGAQGPGRKAKRAGSDRALHETAAREGEGRGKSLHRPPPAGAIALISYMPP